ncbi:NADP-dependent oxidoreductase [Sphingobacterium sp. HJSM2_6]|uniref:NADP-dependent oxidoreductase n=1 Tax=Sphingobacterium sp. HJSM2_6 TaxID=3366264 RepID=UPI003BE1E131
MNTEQTSHILIANSYGRADVLSIQEMNLAPVPKDHARILVKAAGINPIDARRMSGEFKHAGLPQTFGTEFAGEIIALGSTSEKFHISDAVLGSGGNYTHATLIDVPLVNLIKKPEELSWEVAGSIAGVAQTAMTILDELGPIQTLLIHGASGAVGAITAQIALKRGIQVIGTAAEKNVDYVKSLGLIGLAYGPELTKRIQEVFPYPIDASVDMSGSEEATQTSLAVIKPDGIISSIAGKPSTSARVIPIWVKRNPSNLQYVVDGIASNQFSWKIDSVFPFDQAKQAYQKVLEGKPNGKVVLTF